MHNYTTTGSITHIQLKQMTSTNRNFIRTIRSFHLPSKKQCNLQVTRPRPSWLNSWIWCGLPPRAAHSWTICLVVVTVNEVRAPRPSWRAGCRPYRRKSTRIHPGRAWHMNRNSSPRCSAKLARMQYQTPVSKGWDLISMHRIAIRNRTDEMRKLRTNSQNMQLYDQVCGWNAQDGPKFVCFDAWRFSTIGCRMNWHK